MLTMYPRLAVSGGAAGVTAAAGQEEEDDDESHVVCYAFAVACVMLVLFCVLLAVVSVARACAITGVLVLLVGLSVWFVPIGAVHVGGVAPRRDAAGLAPEPTVRAGVAMRGSACGMGDAAIAALPTFAYARPAAIAGGSEGSGKPRGSSLLCAVCLEDAQAGETVRQLPACGHLFHAPCIDAWLRTRRTCPLCRADLISPRKIAVKATSAPATASPADGLPPV